MSVSIDAKPVMNFHDLVRQCEENFECYKQNDLLPTSCGNI